MFNLNLISSMKKVLFVVALCVSVVLANAQEQKVEKKETKEVKKVEKTTVMPGRAPIKEADLLQPIKDNIAKDFAGAKFIKATKLDAKGLVTYEVIVMKDNVRWLLVYDKDGKFVRKEEMKKPEVRKPQVTKPEEPKK